MTENHQVHIRTLLFKGGKVWHQGAFQDLDLLTSEGGIKEIAAEIKPPQGARIIDASGLHIMPGLVDLHVHLREPGFAYKETVAGGTMAAARGGFTTVCSMPNLSPAPDSAATLQQQLDIIDRDAVVEVLPYMTITDGRKGRAPIDTKGVDLGRIAGFSDDGNGVQDAAVMERCMAALAGKGMIAAHCEVNDLLRGGYIHDGRWCAANGHKGICSQSEWAEVERDIELAARTGAHLHICHISTAESVELVRRAKQRGLKVTCETGPHYLAYCEDDLRDEGRFKMNPPLRAASDRYALRRGVADGTVDAIATDHAPHAADEKNRGLAKSAMGVVGLETALGAVTTHMVRTGLMTLERLVETMSITPRRLLGKPTELKPGVKADLTIADFDAHWTVDPADFAGTGRSTPFEGETLTGRPVMTVVGGRPVYDTLL